MTPPGPEPQREDAAPGDGPSGAGAPALTIEDRAERRIRKPADLLRLILGGAGLILLAGLGIEARATTAGLKTDIVRAWQHLPGTLLSVLGIAAGLALLILPVALAVRQVVFGHPRRLTEAAATAVAAAGVIAALNWLLLRLPAGNGLHAALTVPHGGMGALDGYLAAFAAYITVIDISGQPRWQSAAWVAVGIYGLTGLVAVRITILSLAVSLLAGGTVGVGVRYAAGLPSTRPAAADIAAALGSVGLPITAIRRVTSAVSANRCYGAQQAGGRCLDVTVLDRDQQGAGTLYRLYRMARLRRQVSRGMPLSLEHAVERRALLCYATAHAGVPTPRLRAVIRVGPDATALVHDHHAGATLAESAGEVSDAQLRAVWRAVLRLHGHGVTHRALTADRVLLAGDGKVMLLDLGNGDVAATDLACRLDLAQLLAETALVAGPDRAADAAQAEAGAQRLASLPPLLQPVALYRTTRRALRQHRDLLPALRGRLLAATPPGQVPSYRLERVRPRTLVSLVTGVAAGYVLAGQLARVSIPSIIRHADWRWTAVAFILSGLTYLAAATSLTGFVFERLRFGRTCLVQLAASFVTLVAPAAVGGAALNIRYLQRNRVPPAAATATVGVMQVVAFVLYLLLLVIFAAITGAGGLHSPHPPAWVYWSLVGLVVALIAAIAVPPTRRLLRARLVPTLGQVVPRLLDVAQRPRKLAAAFGGTLLLTAAYVLCLVACTRALGGAVPVASAAVVYLTGSALGSAAPTPGGLGAVEVALSAGLSAAGLAGATALSAVLLFRLLTFWLPAPLGWLAFGYLQRRHEL